MVRAAILIFAGPETPCRVVHAFVFARDIAARGGDARIILEGDSPGWLLVLLDPEHRLHGMYEKVKGARLIDAVCKACATQAGAIDAAREEGFRVVDDASGHVSLAHSVERGYQIVTL